MLKNLLILSQLFSNKNIYIYKHWFF